MNYKRLFLFIEGNDDERFFGRIIKPIYEEKYDVKLWKYAHQKNKKIENFLKSVKSMKADYIFVADINLAPCIADKKQIIQKK